MSSFSILHLTDLHFGQRDSGYFGGVEQEFFRDIRETFPQIGGWDLIVIGGDIAYSGKMAEFEVANKFFERLLNFIGDLQKSEPPLLAIPGNHDLIWADDLDPSALVMVGLGAQWPHQEKVWAAILSDAASPFHQRITACFANYSKWWMPWAEKIETSNRVHLHEGCLPGEFTACFTKDGTRIGIVGLNSSILQLTKGNFEGKLALHPGQFNKSLPEKGLSWFDALDAALLLTHHPPEWLSPANNMQFKDSIDHSGRFVVHLSGHLHKPRTMSESLGFAPGRTLVTGPSLFGFERSTSGFDRLHGYGTIKIECHRASGRGTVRYFPRAARRMQSGSWSFARDNDFDLQDSDGGTRPNNGGFTINRPLSDNDEKLISPPPQPPPELTIPKEVYELPEINAASVNAQFVGRGRILEDFRVSLRGILVRGTGGDRASASVAQLFWIHGFGGMGKSWFVRRACVEAANSADGACRVGLVDWHPYPWHRPASTPPRDPAEMIHAIAYRITKIYGGSLLADYWSTWERLGPKWQLHRQWHDKLDEALSFLEEYGNDWRKHFVNSITAHGPPSELRTRIEKTASLLDSLGTLQGTPDQIRAKVAQLRLSIPPQEIPEGGIFDNWTNEFNIADAEVARPTRTLAESLQRCLRAACAETPLLLALDTCEILSQHAYKDLLNEWLRFLLSPLVNSQVPILIIAASRHRADSEVSTRFAWRDLVDPVSFRSIDFDQTPFTRADIQQLLEQKGISPKVSTSLALNVYDLTHGVPLATATLLDNSTEDGLDLVDLDWLNFGFGSELNRARALEKMIEVVAKRFILHLARRPDDFRDIVALALLLHTEKEILSKFWRPRNLHQRLHELTERYTLLLDGDLHPTVRDFLRQHWRIAPPPELSAIADALLSAHDESKPNDDDTTEDSLDWALERLNLLSWTKGEDAYPDFARSLVTLLALGEPIESLRFLACEIKPTRKSGIKIQSALSSDTVRYFTASSIPRDVLSWIEREVSRSGDEREKAYLNLLRALQHNEAQEFDSAVASFKKGFEYFGTKLPRKEIFAQAYLRAVVGVGQRHSELAKEAIRWCDSVGFDPDDEWNQDFYWVLHNSMNYERTREYCNRVVSEDPNNLPAYAFLGHIHAVHLHEGEEAERVFRRGLAIDPDDPTLHYFLADLLADQVDRKEEAELEYEKTLSHIVDSADEARVRTALASFYSNAGQHDKAAATFRRLLQLKVEPDLLNLYAWALYKANKDLYEAAQNADAGRKLAPQDIHLLHTHLAILVRMNEWHIALPLLRRWLAATSDEHLKSAWKDFVLTFQDAVSFGHATEFAKLFDAIPCSLIFDLTRRALLATTDDENATSGLSAINQDAVRELARQMRGTDVDLRFPPFE